MKRYAIKALCGALLVAPALAFSATTEVTWQEPERYRDIEAAGEHRDRHQDRILTSLEQTFERQAQSLPENHTFEITVTDVDLAGRVETMRTGSGFERVRVIRSAYQPSMVFDYHLRDAEGNTIESGEASIRGRMMPEQGFIARPGQQDVVKFESDMIERWFRRTFDY